MAAQLVDPPSTAALREAAAVLKRLSPDAFLEEALDATQAPELAALRDVGRRVFGPCVLQERFGQADVVAYLKEKNRHAATLKKLTKLQQNIDREHALMRSQSAQAEINKQREERFAARREIREVARDEQDVLLQEKAAEEPRDGFHRHEIQQHAE